MRIFKLKDSELLSQTKRLRGEEREVLTKMLQHLREIERRRLFSELGYSSMFDYAMKELDYSEDEAIRRLKAMRLVRELPEVEEKIADGSLSLTNVARAQSFFVEVAKSSNHDAMKKSEKLEVLEKLYNKSTREGQRELMKLQPEIALPQERERVLTEDNSEVRFVMSKQLKDKLEEVRSLLGPKGAAMNYAELFEAMSELSLASLKAKKFGKKRTASQTLSAKAPVLHGAHKVTRVVSQNVRHIPRAEKHIVWNRSKGCCENCGTKRNLNFDHILPVAMGGKSVANNLRILCFSCNQRAAMKTFGTKFMESYR